MAAQRESVSGAEAATGRPASHAPQGYPGASEGTPLCASSVDFTPLRRSPPAPRQHTRARSAPIRRLVLLLTLHLVPRARRRRVHKHLCGRFFHGNCPPPPPPRTKWTRRVPHPVLIGHAASLTTARKQCKSANHSHAKRDATRTGRVDNGLSRRGAGQAERPRAACPIGTGGGTRRVQLVREGGGGGGATSRRFRVYCA
jgi:hypothetical protein